MVETHEKIVRKGEWFYDVRSQTLIKWMKDSPLVVPKGRGLDKPVPNEGDYKPI